jgi:hypothetical protein
MATTTGRVQRLFLFPSSGGNTTACASIGSLPNPSTLLFVQLFSTDPDHILAFKNSIIDALSTALVGLHPVSAEHGNTSAEITSLTIVA